MRATIYIYTLFLCMACIGARRMQIPSVFIPVDLTTGCTSQYFMNDNASNTTVTDSKGGYTATASANTSVLTATGKVNACLYFSSSAYAQSTTFPNITGSCSVAFWIKTTQAAVGTIVMKMNEANYRTEGWYVLMAADGTINWGTGNTTGLPSAYNQAASTHTVNDGSWHHVACTYSSTQMLIYVDGVIDGIQNSVPSSLATNSRYLQFARRSDGFGPDRYLTGYLDDVRMFTKTLSQSEVGFLFNRGNGTESRTGAY